MLSTARAGRLATLFAAPPPRPTTADADPRQLVDRRLYDEIGAFLFTHGLSPTPANFGVAHAYLSGSDVRVAGEISAMLAETGALDHGRIALLAQPAASGTTALVELADRLEAQLREALSAADRSHSSARDYGDALDIAQARLASDPAGTLAHIAGLTRDVVATTRLVESELRQTREETERLRGDLDTARDAAERDHLTGLPNRRAFDQRLAEMLAQRDTGGAPEVAVVLCDIDDFKAVNDCHGHQAGDRVLRFVGGFLRDELGAAAFVARYGGEEFAVLIEGHACDAALALVDAVRERLARRSLINQDTLTRIGAVTFSAGLAMLAGDAAHALHDADTALYRAKREGKNRVALAA